MRLQDTIKRHKWRLRPLKRTVLPLRRSQRGAVAFLRLVIPGLSEALGIERFTSAYARRTPGCSAIEIYPPESVKTLPNPFADGNTQFQSVCSEAASVFRLKDIYFWARDGGCVITPDNLLLGDLSPEVWGIENHPVLSRMRLPQPQRLTGQTAILVTLVAAGNYYHWLIDLLPRFLLVKAAAGGFDSFAHFLINGSHASYESASLNALGVPLRKVSYVNSRQRFRITSAMIPSMDHDSKTIAPWKIRVLQEWRDVLLSDRPYSGSRRLYVSRNHAAVRRLLNEKKLEPLLRAAGFTLVDLESHPWLEQVRLFANAEVILAPHGAGLANIAFCKPGTVITEISTRAGFREYFLRLASSGSLRHRLIEAKPRVQAKASSLRAVENEDMMLDEEKLRLFLRDLG